MFQASIDNYWGPKVLGHNTHQHLLDSVVHESLKVFEMAKMVQLSMNGPNVNLKFFKKLKEQRKKLESPRLIDFGSCHLHIVYGTLKPCVETGGWNLKKLLKFCFQLLKDTPTRREDFVSVTELSRFPLQFCATRLLKLFIF